MLPISERMAMAISITNDIICDFLTGMILFWTAIRLSITDKKAAICVCSSVPGTVHFVFLISEFDISRNVDPEAYFMK